MAAWFVFVLPPAVCDSLFCTFVLLVLSARLVYTFGPHVVELRRETVVEFRRDTVVEFRRESVVERRGERWLHGGALSGTRGRAGKRALFLSALSICPLPRFPS